MDMIFYIRVLLCIFLTLGHEVDSEDTTLYHITPNTDDHLEVLKKLVEKGKYEFLIPAVVDRKTIIAVNASLEPELDSFLDDGLMKWSKGAMAVKSVGEVNRYITNNLSSFTWDGYYSLDDITSWMQDLIKTYPDVASSIDIGRSLEKRNTMGLKILHGKDTEKKVIFLECGIHSREWISPATCTFIANELLTSKDTDIRKFAEEFEWIIVPVTNPDGYIWTFLKNRLWRKNRRPFGNGVYGVDLNRNFDVFWSTDNAPNASYSRNYPGPTPISEPETQNLAKYYESIADRLELHLSFHSYDQFLIFPYGYNDTKADNYDDLKSIADKAVEAIAVRYGTAYKAGTIAELTGAHPGTSHDFVKYHFNIPLVYCFEMRSADYQVGFFLPAEEIIPNSLEVLNGILSIIKGGKQLGYLNGNI